MSEDQPDPAPTSPRSPMLMRPEETALLVIDIQEKLMAAQPQAATIAWNARRLAEGARALGVRVASTEQVPEKLGPTLSEVAASISQPAIAKTEFSAVCAAASADWASGGIDRVLLCGIETHVCVQQTALDLASAGYLVFLAVDAIGSRYEVDHDTALRRMESAGVSLTTTEAALFEWCGGAEHSAFKTVSNLAKEHPPMS